MLKRRQLIQLSSGVAVAGAGAAAWMVFGSRGSLGSQALGGGPFRHYPFDSVAAANFQQKLFIPVASGSFGALDVAASLKLRTTAASFPLLPGPASQAPSPFLLYQTEHAGQAYQNPILRIESGARFTAILDRALTEPTIVHWHGLHTPAKMDGHPRATIAPGAHMIAEGGRGVTYPIALLLSIAIGVWLTFTRVGFGSSGAMADSDHLIGALVVTFSIIAFAEVARAVRFINVPFGAWLIAAPWLLDGIASPWAAWNGVICGALLIGLAIPRGPVKNSYAGWNRYVV